jgi:hypothetical protein
LRGSGREVPRSSAKEEVKERSLLKISKIRVRDNSKDSSDSAHENEQENISDNLIAAKSSSDIVEKACFSVAPTTNPTITVPPKIAATSSSTVTKKKK